MNGKIFSLLFVGSLVLSAVLLNSCSNTGTFTDSRDGKEYKRLKIGEQVWMAENLAYTGNDIKHITDDKEWVNNIEYDAWCYYENSNSKGKIYGVLYQWEAALIACPDGWHLPTDEEWKQLEGHLYANVGSQLAGDETLWKDGKLKQSMHFGFSGFNALPGGLCSSGYGMFQGLGDSGFWWSATEDNSSCAYDRYLIFGATTVSRYGSTKSGGFSVRCVRD
jgi:uncharacterized protein (TIGR02145 family)